MIKNNRQFIITIFDSFYNNNDLFQKSVNIKYEKLLCDVQGNKTLDILVKKLKHQMVESMSSTTADALGLSRYLMNFADPAMFSFLFF